MFFLTSFSILDSCRHLKELRVTVSIHDYWEDARKKKNREDYKKILASLEVTFSFSLIS